MGNLNYTNMHGYTREKRRADRPMQILETLRTVSLEQGPSDNADIASWI